MRGTRYFGTDWSKLKVAILADTKTEKAKIIIYGNLNNFSSKGNDSREKWIFARIEKYVYRRGTDLGKNPLPDPEDIKIEEISDNNQSLKNRKKGSRKRLETRFPILTNWKRELEN